jgi:catechol 2,3-dioxygenase-like lactoylglutathione lyase family enzyme
MTAIGWRATHVHIYASDPDETVRWLTDGLGGELISTRTYAGRPTMTNVLLGGQLVQVRGSTDAERFVAQEQRAFGWDHIGLVVPDVDAAVAELASRGIEPVTEFGSGFECPDGVVFLRGPDGIWVEVAPSKWYPDDPRDS